MVDSQWKTKTGLRTFRLEDKSISDEASIIKPLLPSAAAVMCLRYRWWLRSKHVAPSHIRCWKLEPRMSIGLRSARATCDNSDFVVSSLNKVCTSSPKFFLFARIQGTAHEVLHRLKICFWCMLLAFFVCREFSETLPFRHFAVTAGMTFF